MTDSQRDVYRSLGVSPTKEDVHKAIADQDKGLLPGGFCKVLPDLMAGSPEHCLALHADGAGTKSVLAYLYWKETGDASVFRGLAQDSLVMNLDDLACIGAVSGFVVSNTIGRNAHRIPGEIIAEVIAGYDACAAALGEHGVTVHMAGGETADVGDLVATIICDSTVAVRMRRDRLIDASRIGPGQVIVGFSSFGQAAWETVENSGMGSNGLTAARHVMLKRDYAVDYPEAFSSTLKPDEVFSGPHGLTDPLPGSSLNVGQALLSPTRTYVPLVKALIESLGVTKIHGLIHNSGGGLTKVNHFARDCHIIKDNLFEMPPLFKAICDTGHMTEREMNEVFNCGQRLEAYLDESDVEAALASAKDAGIEAQVIGRVEAGDTGPAAVTITRAGHSEVY